MHPEERRKLSRGLWVFRPGLLRGSLGTSARRAISTYAYAVWERRLDSQRMIAAARALLRGSEGRPVLDPA